MATSGSTRTATKAGSALGVDLTTFTINLRADVAVVAQAGDTRPSSDASVVQETNFTVRIDVEDDGRFIGEVPELRGALAYGATADIARAQVKALALRILADRVEHGDTTDAIRFIERPMRRTTKGAGNRVDYFAQLVAVQPTPLSKKASRALAKAYRGAR